MWYTPLAHRDSAAKNFTFTKLWRYGSLHKPTLPTMYTENFSRWLGKASWKIKYAYVHCISTFVNCLWFKIGNKIVSWNYNTIDLLSKERYVNVIGVLRIVVALCLLFRRDPFEEFILKYRNFDKKV